MELSEQTTRGHTVQGLQHGEEVTSIANPAWGVGVIESPINRRGLVLVKWEGEFVPALPHDAMDLQPALGGSTEASNLGEEEAMDQELEMDQTVLDAGGMLGHIKGFENTETGSIYKVEWENGKSTRHVPGALYPVAPIEVNKVPTPKDVKNVVTSIASKAPEIEKGLSYDVLDVIEAWDLNFSLGNVIQLVVHAGQEDKAQELEDLKLAAAYLKRRIDKLEAGK